MQQGGTLCIPDALLELPAMSVAYAAYPEGGAPTPKVAVLTYFLPKTA